MSTTDVKFEFYIDSTTGEDTSTSLSPAEATDLGLNSGIVVDQLGGGITFSNAGSIKGGKTDWDVGIGFWLGYQDEDYKVAIGDPANEKVTWDGDDLVIDIDSSNLTINGGTAGQALSVDANGVVTFIDPVENLDDLGDVTGTTYSASTYQVLIPQSGNTYGFADLRSVTDTYIRLRDLSDVSNVAASTNQLLVYNGTSWAPVTTIPTSAISLAFEDLSNAEGGTPQVNDVWKKTSTGWAPTQFNLNNLTNTNITSPANGSILQYNSTTQNWEDATASSLFSGQSLGQHTDTTFSTLPTTAVKHRIVWDGTNSYWKNEYDSLQNIYNVDGTYTTGKTIVYSSVTGRWTPTTLPTHLNHLTNVNNTNLQDGQIMEWDSSAGTFVNVDSGLDALPYTLETSTNPASPGNYERIRLLDNNNVVRGETKFRPGTNMTITRSSNTITFNSTAGANPIFKTIAVSGQSDVVADTTTDTLTLAAGTGMTITTDANTDTVTFAASGGGGSKWTDSVIGTGIYRNSNVAVNMTAACSHALRVGGVIHTIGSSSANGIIFDNAGAPITWEMNSDTDFHIKRGIVGLTDLKIGHSTGTSMFPNGICLNGTTTYDVNDTMYDYEIGTVSRNSVSLSNSPSGGTVVAGSTHLDSSLSDTYTYVRSGDMVNLSFQFKIINTANLTTGSFIYLSVPFVPVSGNISTGVINILTPPPTPALNYNAQLQHGYAFLVSGSRLGFAYNRDGAPATSFTLSELNGVTIRGNIVYKAA